MGDVQGFRVVAVAAPVFTEGCRRILLTTEEERLVLEADDRVAAELALRLLTPEPGQAPRAALTVDSLALARREDGNMLLVIGHGPSSLCVRLGPVQAAALHQLLAESLDRPASSEMN